jgi:hypothetical protein
VQAPHLALRVGRAGRGPDHGIKALRGHYEVIDPLSDVWPVVLEAFRSAAAGPGSKEGASAGG